ncbi:MAG: hypothetical protein ACI8QS_000400 [Planctomycetota bacterium]|jgi:hypothetical protein
MSLKRALFTSVLLSTLVCLPQADKIILNNGEVIEEVTIKSEGLKEVVYDAGRDKGMTVDSDSVRKIEYEKLPSLVDEAQSAMRGGDPGLAVDTLLAYIEKYAEKPDSRYGWGPAYASWSVIVLRRQFGDLGGVIEGSKNFVRSFPESRYLPMVFMSQASALHQAGEKDELEKTLAAFRNAISTQGLSERWSLEADLMEARAKGGSLGSQRSALEAIGQKAGTRFPSVAGRASVAVGEALLADADKNVSDQDRAAKSRAEAEELFEGIVKDATLDDSTLAGAYAGLGECLFYRGAADSQNVDTLKLAVRALLRVPLLYETESAYVPKALFLAGRSFDMMGDRDRKRQMRRELERDYPSSPWTAEAAKLLR